MQTLYPEIKPYKKHHLAVDTSHTLYIEESGDPNGLPVVFVHGGPGIGCSHHDRRFFDPEQYRIILFDQRGAGQSTPHACLDNNTSADLVADMEKIRQHLHIDQWMLFGGSWGSTLSLLYAQSYPEHVTAMVLRGIFLCRQEDLLWLYQEGAHRVYPDFWQDFMAPVADSNPANNIEAYYQKLTGDNELAKMAAAKAWALWEARCATLKPSPELETQFCDPHIAVALARIEAHYFINHAFMEDNQILIHADKLSGIPGILVHGRYDMVCPLDNAHTLYNHWPDAELHIIRDAGHSSHEPGIIDALIKATNEMAQRLKGEGNSRG